MTRRRRFKDLDLQGGSFHEPVGRDGFGPALYEIACYDLRGHGGGYAVHVASPQHLDPAGLLLVLRGRGPRVERYVGADVTRVQARYPNAPQVTAYRLSMRARCTVDEHARAWSNPCLAPLRIRAGEGLDFHEWVYICGKPRDDHRDHEAVRYSYLDGVFRQAVAHPPYRWEEDAIDRESRGLRPAPWTEGHA